MGDGFKFPAMKPAELKKILLKIGYKEPSEKSPGSHNKLTCDGRKPITWAFHDSKREIAPNEVKKILVKQAGLTIEEAKRYV